MYYVCARVCVYRLSYQEGTVSTLPHCSMKPPNQNSKPSGSGDPQAMNKCNFWSPPSKLKKTGVKHLAQKSFENF